MSEVRKWALIERKIETDENSVARSSPSDRTRAQRRPHYDETPVQKPDPQPYKYSKLEKAQSIRLLKVRLVLGQGRFWGKVLKCRITHHDLNDQPFYTAISYTGGSDQSLLDLDVEGEVLRVRGNVSHMLERLANLEQWRTLWVDAICIYSINPALHTSIR